MSDIPLALIGMGKMGRALAALAPEAGFRVVAELDPARPLFEETSVERAEDPV